MFLHYAKVTQGPLIRTFDHLQLDAPHAYNAPESDVYGLSLGTPLQESNADADELP